MGRVRALVASRMLVQIFLESYGSCFSAACDAYILLLISYANTLWHVGSSFSAACDASVRLAYSNKCSLYVS
jgi:hypothetical protein